MQQARLSRLLSYVWSPATVWFDLGVKLPRLAWWKQCTCACVQEPTDTPLLTPYCRRCIRCTRTFCVLATLQRRFCKCSLAVTACTLASESQPHRVDRYHVERMRDGRSFATRAVTARQRGKAIFTMQVLCMLIMVVVVDGLVAAAGFTLLRSHCSL